MSSTNKTSRDGGTLQVVAYQWALEIIIAVLSLTGNFLIILAFKLTPALQVISNYFVVNLALTDMLVGLIAVPFSLAITLGFPYYDYYGCLLLNCLVVIFTQVSVFSLVGIALERLIAIKLPLRYNQIFTKRVCLFICIATWLSGILVGIVPLFGWNLNATANGACSFMSVIDLKYMVYFNFFVCILPPLVIVFAIYSYIFSIVLKHTRGQVGTHGFSTVQRNTNENTPRRSELKAARSLAIVIVVFALSWLPLHICNTLSVFQSPNGGCPLPFLHFTILLSHANSMFNPFIYAVSYAVFRRSFSDILRCRKPRKFNNDTS